MHSFRRIVAFIINKYALTQLNENHALFRPLSDIQTGAKEARHLTQQLLTFSRGGEPIKKPENMNQILKESARLVTSGAKSICEFNLADDLWSVEMDAGQLNQAIGNIVINATQAMPEGGIIQIEAENEIIDDEHAIPLPPGPFIHINIKDCGIGIPEKHLSRIFEPFFTTKHKGNGLGLATTFSIIKRHDGHISVASEPGDGTTFDIYLPASGKNMTRGEEKPGL